MLKREYPIVTKQATVDVIHDAALAPYGRDKQSGQFYGGIYDRNMHYRTLSSRLWMAGKNTEQIRLGAQKEFPSFQNAEFISGESVYCGDILSGYGHFLLESTARLWWPIENTFKGNIIFHSVAKPKPFMIDFFKLLGIYEQCIFTNKPLKFEKIYIPQASFSYRGYVMPTKFMATFQALAYITDDIPLQNRQKKIFLSDQDRAGGESYGLGELQDVLEKQGYEIINPAALTIEQQIKIINQAKTIGGVTGSALHNVIFATHKPKVFSLDRTYPGVANQKLIHYLREIDAFHITRHASARVVGHSRPFYINTAYTVDELQKNNFLPTDTHVSKVDIKTYREYLADIYKDIVNIHSLPTFETLLITGPLLSHAMISSSETTHLLAEMLFLHSKPLEGLALLDKIYPILSETPLSAHKRKLIHNLSTAGYLEKYLDATKESVIIRYYIAQLLFEAKQKTQANLQLKKAIALTTRDFIPQLAAAKFYLLQNNIKKTDEICKFYRKKYGKKFLEYFVCLCIEEKQYEYARKLIVRLKKDRTSSITTIILEQKYNEDLQNKYLLMAERKSCTLISIIKEAFAKTTNGLREKISFIFKLIKRYKAGG